MNLLKEKTTAILGKPQKQELKKKQECHKSFVLGT